MKQYVLCIPAAVTVTRTAAACKKEGVELPEEIVPSLPDELPVDTEEENKDD